MEVDANQPLAVVHTVEILGDGDHDDEDAFDYGDDDDDDDDDDDTLEILGEGRSDKKK